MDCIADIKDSEGVKQLMKILFSICGRAGSKGIKNKNLKEFLGLPLAFYTISSIDLFSKSHPNVNFDIVLNTDSQDLIQMFQEKLSLKVNVVERESSLGLDNTPKIAVILNSLEVMKTRTTSHYDMVVDLDITSPLRTVVDINNLINKMSTSSADVVFSVTDSRRNPYFNMVKHSENEGYVRVLESTFNTRQEAPEIFDMNASLYAYSPEFLESKRGIFDGRCEIIQMKDTAVLDIDNEGDFELMEVIATYMFEKYPLYREIRDNIKNIYREC